MALRTLTQTEWQQYLTDIGIPEVQAKTYATSFHIQQIPKNLLKLISDEELHTTFDIKPLGHRLLIRNAASEQSSTPQTTPRPQVRHQPPQLKPSMTPSSFRAFVSHWKVYKSLVGIVPNGHDAAAQIFSLACSDHPEIRITVADHNPDHLLFHEPQYLDMLRKLLTAQATPETYRHKFFNLTQGANETCQDWLKRLQEVIIDCEFTLPCNQKEGVVHRFDDSLLRSKFILGTHNMLIKQDLLTKSLELSTLNEVFNHATGMEATARDMSLQEKTVGEIHLRDNSPPSTSDEDELYKISTYRKQLKSKAKYPQRQPQRTPIRPCDGCGSTFHAPSERSTKCTAWKKVCSNCGKRGHLAKVCRGEKSTEYANAVIAVVSNTPKITNNEIELLVTKTGHSSTSSKEARISFLPDTGASLCVTGFFILKKLGINLSQLKKTSRRILTATGDRIHCRGWFAAQLSVDGNVTTHNIYVCDNIQRSYLSKEGCIALGIVHSGFPRPITTKETNTPTSSTSITLPDRPAELPYADTLENIPLLEKYLLKLFSQTAFNDNKNRFFPKMLRVPQAHIHLKPDAKPYCRTTPNQLPHFWKAPTKKLLDQWVNRGMIRKTPIGTPTPWCFPMVITPKKSNTAQPKLRITVDLQHLNRQCIRELHHVESPFKLASQVPKNTYKTLLDAVDGYQQIELDKESQSLTNFITHWGPYHFLRLPAGLIDSGDKYTSRYDSVIQHIPRKVKCVDDTLLYDSTIKESFYHTFDYLRTCAAHGIVLNPSKFKFCRKEITFTGFRITFTGIKPSDSTLKAIRDFPTPKSTTDIRSWFGLVRQVAFAHSVSEDLAPLRGLLKHSEGEKPKFMWNEMLQHAFDKSKEHVVKSVTEGIQSFDQLRWTCLQCDWSKDGIGFILLQKYCECEEPHPSETVSKPCCDSGWKPCYAGSRFTNEAESRYAPTEGEALAVAWALKTSRLFTLGCPKLIIVTDHKPLLGILNGRDLGSIKNPRIRRLKEHTLDYQFQIKHCPGKFHLGADALSRYPVLSAEDRASNTDSISEVCEIHMEGMVNHVIDHLADVTNGSEDATYPAVITMDKLELECLSDKEYTELHNLVQSGFPTRRGDTPSHAKTFWPLAQKGLLFTHRNIVVYQERLVIPKSLQTYIIQVLHSAHQGCTGMLARAGRTVYWPGIRKHIMSYQTNCRSCVEISPSQAREPLTLSALPDRPFQVICSDLFQLHGHFYLIVVDRFSGFLHICYSKESPNHQFLQKHLRDIFMRYGRPEQLDSDGGPQFQAQPFKDFLASWGVRHRLSSPYYPQSNGRAEVAVKTAKRLLRDNTGPLGSINNNKVACAVLQYHNTPLQDGPMSPAQLLFGRTLADFLPANPSAYQLHPHWTEQIQRTQQQRSSHHSKAEQRYNFGTRMLSPLAVGQQVVIQSQYTKRWDRSGTVTEVLPYRKYKLLLSDTGNLTFRNRRFLKPRTPNLTGSEQYSGPLSGPPVPTRRIPDSAPAASPVRVERTQPHNTTTQPQTSTSDAQTELLQERDTRRLPLAMRRLLPYNNPGITEAMTGLRRSEANEQRLTAN